MIYPMLKTEILCTLTAVKRLRQLFFLFGGFL